MVDEYKPESAIADRAVWHDWYRQILEFSKLKELADDSFRFDENGRKFS